MTGKHTKISRTRVLLTTASVAATIALILSGCTSSGNAVAAPSSLVPSDGTNSASASAGPAVSGGLTSHGGGGGGLVTTDQIEARLRKDPQISSLKTQFKGNAKAYDVYVECAAAVIRKDADPSKLQDYVDGKTDLSNLGNAAQSQKADADAATCIKTAVGS